MSEKIGIKSSTKMPDDDKVSIEITEAFDDTEALDLGKSFREARAQKGLTQEQAGKFLKVRVKLITDFEEGMPLDLPGLTYQIGFVRSYANLVELDADYIVEAYKNSLNINDPRVTYNFLEARQEKKSIYPLISLAAFLVCLISYSAWYYNSVSYNEKTEFAQKNENEYQNKNALDYVKIENQSDKNKIKIEEKEKTIKNKNLVNFDLSPKDNLDIKKPLTSELVNKKMKGPQTENKTNEFSAIANERDRETEMVLKSTGNSWVEIEDLDGKSLITRLMRPGETYVIPKTKGLTLSTGNAGVLSLTFGKLHISKLGEVGEVISSRPLNIEAFNQR
tara:strand:- start:1014 stop:2018 length:1005 start_codon:yes stop_codon:yes gene_type:complete